MYTTGQFTCLSHWKRSNIGHTLTEFCNNVGIPVYLKTDRAPKLCRHMTPFIKLKWWHHISLHYAESEQEDQTWPADLEVWKFTKRWHNKISEKNVPVRLQDYGMKYVAKIMQFIPQELSGRSGYDDITADRPDIWEYLAFDFHDLVWHHAKKHPSLTKNVRELSWWTGVAPRIGIDMCH